MDIENKQPYSKPQDFLASLATKFLTPSSVQPTGRFSTIFNKRLFLGIFIIIVLVVVGIKLLEFKENSQLPTQTTSPNKSNELNSKASFTGKYQDHKVHNDQTGENFLNVDIEINVRKKGNFVLYGFLKGATVKDVNGEDIYIYGRRDLFLNQGVQKVTLSFDGKEIFNGEFDHFILHDLSLLSSENEGSALFDKTDNLVLSPYNWRDFRRTRITIKNQSLDYPKIVENLISMKKLDFFSGKQEIKEVSPEEIFGLKIPSLQYILYSYQISNLATFSTDDRFLALATDKSGAFFIENDEDVSDFVSFLNLKLSSLTERDIVNLSQGYLKLVPLWESSHILWELPKPEEDKTWGPGGLSFRDWFAWSKEYEFHSPKVQKLKEGCSVEYYTWSGNAGVLYYEYFELRENGEVIKHTEKNLGERIGNYIII